MGSRLTQTCKSVALLLALLCVTVEGGQTHLAFSEGETVSVQICGKGGIRTVETAFGGDLPPEDTAPGHCDDCTPAPGALLLKAQLASELQSLPIRVLLSRQGEPVHPGGPLWPGAPPNGPPISA